MLQELRILDLGVIDEAVIEPHPGLTVVTGETGAGKTMVVTALGLICGGRGQAGKVRAGSRRAAVEIRCAPLDGVHTEAAGWDIATRDAATAAAIAPDAGADAGEAGADDGPGQGPGPTGPDATAERSGAAVLAALVEAVGGRFDDDGSLIAARTLGADGRSRAHIGGRSVPVGVLTELAEPLIAVHGQSEAISLLRPGPQRAVLDRFAGLTADVAAYHDVRSRWQRMATELADARARARDRAQREQLLRMGLSEIEAVDPQPGEDRELVDEVRRLQNLDGLRAAAMGAQEALNGADEAVPASGAAALVHGAQQLLTGADDPRLGELADQLRQSAVVMTDVAAELSGYLDGLNDDPGRLTQLLERQAALRALTRRYGQDVDAVRDWAVAAARELTELDCSEDRLAQRQRELDELRDELGRLAARLSVQRSAAADRLGRLVTAELGSLAMARATVRVRVGQRAAEPDDPQAVPVDLGWRLAGPDGVDQVEIVMVAHPGAPELPIAKGASGGELSRVMLALEVVLADADPVSTMVFDEVDAGVGGRAATEIGARLAALARTHQVIVVTHLAQVAAHADRHYVVDADASGRIGTSNVRLVAGRDRERELARMLGGTNGTTARAHARELLTAARRTEVIVLRRAG
jgi:DNA repair protein RecN (Recombination protein N)